MVKCVFGKKVEAVMAAKPCRQLANVLLDLELVFWGSWSSLVTSRGLVQQPYRHTRSAALKQGDCILSDVFTQLLGDIFICSTWPARALLLPSLDQPVIL